MVALATPATRSVTPRRTLGWTAAAAVVLVGGAAVRLALGGAAVGDRSATLLTVILTLSALLAARLAGGPRTAFLTVLALVALFDLASLPPRTVPEYDDLQAFYRTDQVLTAHVGPADASGRAISVLAQPVFDGTQPAFGLEGEVNGAQVKWSCAFGHDIQRLTLPLPSAVTEADLRLRLTGTPSRETDYLLVYSSSRRGGFVVDLLPSATADRNATVCSMA